MILAQPKLVIIESPYKSTPYYTVEQHRLYLQHCISDCVSRGESPYASHHYMTDVLDDTDPAERAFGIKCGLMWGQHADIIAVYSDFGVSAGMADAIEHYQKIGKQIEWRKLPHKVVASIKNSGELTQQEPPNANICNCGYAANNICFCGLSARS